MLRFFLQISFFNKKIEKYQRVNTTDENNCSKFKGWRKKKPRKKSLEKKPTEKKPKKKKPMGKKPSIKKVSKHLLRMLYTVQLKKVVLSEINSINKITLSLLFNFLVNLVTI